MKKYFVLVLFIVVSFLAGCGDDSITDDDEDSTSSYDGATLTVFTDDVQLCTPALGSIVYSSGSSVLSSWTGWDRNNSNGVIGKVFNTTLDEYEGIYTQIGTLDEHIALVNKFTADFDTAGSHTIGSDTAVVETDVSEVDVPFMGWFFQEPMSVPVDRIVTVTSGSLTVHMAFKITGSTEVIVEQYAIGSTDAGAYYTIRDGNYLAIWHASLTDSTNGVQFTWDGDMGAQTFRLSECSDAGDNWEVMGGGAVDTQSSTMSFMARNDATAGSATPYYISLSLQDLEGGIEKTISNAVTTPPSGAGVLSFITEDDEDCLGFYRTGDYPTSVDDLDWNN